MQLVDYKVRVLDNGAGTGARVRVLIESTDGSRRWGTVGVSANVVEASWQALLDSVEFKLHKDQAKPRKLPATGTDYSGAKGVVKKPRVLNATELHSRISKNAGNGSAPDVRRPKLRRRPGSPAGMRSE